MAAGVHEVTIYRDAGAAGEKAAMILGARLDPAGIRWRIVVPRHGDDFNDDLRHDVSASDYTISEPAGEEVQTEPASPHADGPTTAAEHYAAVIALRKGDFDARRSLIGALIRLELEPLDERQILDPMKRPAGIDIAMLRNQIESGRKRCGSETGANGVSWVGQSSLPCPARYR